MNSSHKLFLAVLLAMVTAPMVFMASPTAFAQADVVDTDKAQGVLGIHVKGNTLIDQNGGTVQLRGVNVSGLESVAIQGWDPGNPWGSQTGTPTPDWTLMQSSWAVNAVRLPLNEASWLGLACDNEGTGGNQILADPGANYHAAVIDSVNEATAAGLYVILDLHWAAPGNVCPTIQNAMADADHSLAFWTSLAAQFKNEPNVMFELFNEPFLNLVSISDGAGAGDYLRNGGALLPQVSFSGGSGKMDYTWTTTGYQEILKKVRAAGAGNVVIIGTLSYDQTMDLWLKYAPADKTPPAGFSGTWTPQVVAATHPYPKTTIELDGIPKILARGIPVVATEFGDAIGGDAPYAHMLLPLLDAEVTPVGYLGWTWDVWPGSTSNVLITDAAGDPTAGYGAYVQAHYLCRATGNLNCP